MFYQARAFDQDISDWDVSSGENFLGMFLYAESFNQDISSWDLKNALHLNAMFYSAESFNQDVSSWDVSNVRNFMGMFFESGMSEITDASSYFVGPAIDIPEPDPIEEVTEPYQTVSTSSNEISFYPGKDINFDLLYTTSDSQNALTGLGLKVHYDSSVFTPSGDNNGVSALVDTFGDPTIIDDTDDFDNNASTDKYLNIIWADLTTEPNFPGTELPATLATINFSSSKEGVDSLTGESKINFTSTSPAQNYDFLSQSVTLKPQSFNLDVDGDGSVTALGDGLMVIRKLFGAAFAGDVLTNKAISNTASRTTTEIHEFIQAGMDDKTLDVDGDGQVTALGDGLMVIRKLFGAAFGGDALTSKAISNNATRTTDEIHEYIAAMTDVDTIT
jgi:surface protein